MGMELPELGAYGVPVLFGGEHSALQCEGVFERHWRRRGPDRAGCAITPVNSDAVAAKHVASQPYSSNRVREPAPWLGKNTPGLD